jgi:hypothetical protein
MQVVKTAPDPQAMKAVLSRIGDAFPKAPESSGAAANANTAKSAGQDAFDTAAQNVAALTNELRHTFDKVSAGADDVRKLLANCKVPDVPGALKVEPEESSHAVSSVPTTLVYSISGGTLPIPKPGLSGEFPADAFRVRPDTLPQVIVEITASAKGHEATLHISDGSGSSRHIKITVGDSAKVVESKGPGTTSDTSKPAPTPAAIPASKLTPQRVAMIRRVVAIPTGASPAPSLTTDEKAKVDAFAAANNKGTDLKRGSELYDFIVGRARAAAQSLPNDDATEVALLDGGKIATLRLACALPAVEGAAGLDQDLHGKVFDYEEAAQQGKGTDPVIDGKLESESELTAMLAAKCQPPTS